MRIIETGNYMELIPLFRESGLEIHIEGDRPPAMITCWRAEDNEGNLTGGVSIERKKGEYIIGDIAVRDTLRGNQLGTTMTKMAIERIKSLGGKRICIVSKAPKFFEGLGFTYLDINEVPDIFNCKDCEQRGKSCHPEFMILKQL